MKRFIFITGFFVVLLMAFAPSAFAGPCPIRSDTNVVIYGDIGSGGVGSLSKSWISQFMGWWVGHDSRIKYVFVDRNDLKNDCNLGNFPNVKVYVQPGGNAYYQQNALGSAGRANILSYLDSGRGYIGICAGAFYAANDYYWQGQFYNWPHLLKRYPTVEGSITDIADYEANPGFAITRTSFADKAFNMLYFGGPTVGWRQTPSLNVGEQRLNLDSISGSLPASIRKDNMLLNTIHAEAFENDGITGLSTEDRIENYKWLANEINSVSGTSFYVPPYVAQTFACNDGIDNDGDELTDFGADPGCISLTDNDEFNSVGVPGEIFYSDFESGLSGWTLNAVSGANNWISGTVNPFQGARYAESKPQSTSEPASIMERTISTEGFSAVSVRYNRKLIGLDTADEFKAKWFDGSIWQNLEQTGSISANDASYIEKSFNLPASAANNAAFKLRFECTAGAVSEFCRVDNVRVTGQ